MRFLILVLAVTMAASLTTQVSAQEKTLTPGQEKIKELEFMIGDWQYEKEDGSVATQSVTFINNESFIQRVDGSVREIVGWDLEEKKFASWMFGGVGGHGKAFWEKKGGSWYLEYKPYYVASGKAVTSFATLTPSGTDTIRIVGQFMDDKFDITLTRVKGK